MSSKLVYRCPQLVSRVTKKPYSSSTIWRILQPAEIESFVNPKLLYFAFRKQVGEIMTSPHLSCRTPPPPSKRSKFQRFIPFYDKSTLSIKPTARFSPPCSQNRLVLRSPANEFGVPSEACNVSFLLASCMKCAVCFCIWTSKLNVWLFSRLYDSEMRNSRPSSSASSNHMNHG